MPFIETLPEWNNGGVEPTQTKKDNGWAVGEKPPASAFNWLQYTAYQSLQELQQYAVHNEDFGDKNNLTTTDKSNIVNALNEVNAQLTEATLTQTLTDTINVLDSDRVTDLILKAFTGQTNVNHVPLFDSGLWNFHANVTVDSPSKITLNADGDFQSSDITISVKDNTNFTFSGDLSLDSRLLIRGVQSATDYINTGNPALPFTFTTNGDTELMIRVDNTNNGAGTYTFENIMLNEGSTAQAFTKNVRPIKNPVLFSKGKNLFDIHSVDLHANAELTDSKTITLNADANGQSSVSTVKVKGSTTYTFNAQTSTNALVKFREKDSIGTQVVYNSITNPAQQITFTTNASTKTIQIELLNDDGTTGSITFSDIMLVVGDSTQLPSEYVGYNPSYLVLKSSFYAGDQPYQDPNGNWRKLAEKKEMALDGSLGWSLHGDYSAFKTVYIPYPSGGTELANHTTVKHDGKILAEQSVTIEADRSSFGTESRFIISVSDSDTGWGESWDSSTTLTSSDFGLSRNVGMSELIPAYFNGWKFINNGAGNGNSYWESVYDSSVQSTDVDEVISRNLHEENGEEGYRLVYELAEKEDVAIESEGSLQLHEGLNQIEMTEALVVREVANPKLDSGSYFITSSTASYWSDSNIKYYADKFIKVYKNGDEDNLWTFSQENADTYVAKIDEADYDPTATYTVTYLALPYQLSAPLDNVDVQFNKSMISVQQGLVDNVTDNERKISVLSETKANKHQEQWKEPTLLNGNTQFSEDVGYYKDELGVVKFRGRVAGGSSNTDVFILPKEYRPNQVKIFIGVSKIDTTNYGYTRIAVTTDGKVTIDDYGTEWNSIENVSFRADQ